MSKHVVILGGGLAGLSCGYEMAKAKIRVTILEREPRVGGMASSFEEGKRENAGQLDNKNVRIVQIAPRISAHDAPG